MRIFGWLTFIAALALAQAAEAQVLGPGPTTITTDNTGQVIPGADYTILGDGVTYRWDLWADSAHPGALIYLGAPNDLFAVGQVSNGDGTTHFDFALPDPIYTWDPTYAPGHTSIVGSRLNARSTIAPARLRPASSAPSPTTSRATTLS